MALGLHFKQHRLQKVGCIAVKYMFSPGEENRQNIQDGVDYYQAGGQE